MRTLWCLPLEQKCWLLPLYLLTAPAWIATLVIPYHRMGRLLGHRYRNIQLVALADRQQQIRAWRFGQLIEALSRYTPWPSQCLVQAMLTRWVLRCYGIPHVLYVGICKPADGSKPLASHAWLCVDRWAVSGGDGHQAFCIVASFVSHPHLMGSGDA